MPNPASYYLVRKAWLEVQERESTCLPHQSGSTATQATMTPFAILLAARSPDVNLLGISTVYGNAPLHKTAYNTRAILKAIGREDVPVYAGAAKPFCREASHASDIHGESGLDGTTCLPTPTVPVKTDRAAVYAMYEALIATPKGTAWVVPTGALTNAALLFAVHPDLAGARRGLECNGRCHREEDSQMLRWVQSPEK